MSKFALIIIDMLNDFFRQQPRLAGQRGSLVASINELSREFRRANRPIIWVRQEFAADLSDAFLEMRRDASRVTIAGTDGCNILPELEQGSGDRIIVKKRYSAFFGTNLDNLLADMRPDALVIAGINSHACVRMTAIDAYQRDCDVIVATDCIASYDMEHHEITKRYLSRGMSHLLTNDEIISLLGS